MTAAAAGLSWSQVLVLASGAGAALVVALAGVVTGVRLAAGAVAWAWRRRRVPRGWLPARAWLAWWRWRKAPVPAGGKALDPIDAGLWAMVLEGYGDRAGTEAVSDAELEAEALMSDTEADS